MAQPELELPMTREGHNAVLRVNYDGGEPVTAELAHRYPEAEQSETGTVMRSVAGLDAEIEAWGISEYVDVVTRSVTPHPDSSRSRRIEWLRLVRIGPDEVTAIMPEVLTMNPQSSENLTRRDSGEWDAHVTGSNEHVLMRYADRGIGDATIDETTTRIKRGIIDSLDGDWFAVRWDGLEHDYGDEVEHEITNLTVRHLRPLDHE